VFEPGIFHPLVVGAEAHQDDDVFIEVPQKSASRAAETKTIGRFNLKSGFKHTISDVSSHAEEGRFSIIDILLYIRSCFDDRGIMDEFHAEDIVNIAAWQAWQAHIEHLRDDNNQELNEKDVWLQEIEGLIARSSHIKPGDMFEEVKRNNNLVKEQVGSEHSDEAD